MQFDEFMKVLDLLKNPASYEAKVAELLAREEAIKAALVSMGAVSDLNKAKTQVEKQLEKAEATVAKAQQEADTIVKNARAVYDKQFAELKAKEVVADQAIANYNAIKNTQASREEALRTAEKEVAKLREYADAERARLAAKESEVDERLAKLRQVMG
jgi:G:T/U-mismatch repair DNA glycosylase